jgi:hypothetical protein
MEIARKVNRLAAILSHFHLLGCRDRVQRRS